MTTPLSTEIKDAMLMFAGMHEALYSKASLAKNLTNPAMLVLGEGHIEQMSNVAEFAWAASTAIDASIAAHGDDDFPGVFHYEVPSLLALKLLAFIDARLPTLTADGMGVDNAFERLNSAQRDQMLTEWVDEVAVATYRKWYE